MDQLLATKFFIPKTQPEFIPRPRLVEQLKDGLHRKLTLVSAPAGFGKTTLVSEWTATCEKPVAWLSLDKEDSDPRRFLTYLVSALQFISAKIGENVLEMLQTTPGPPSQSILTTLINQIAAIPENFIIILDDYHTIEAKPIDQALTFLIENAPPQMHLVITTREDPTIPLARFRTRGQLNEIRVADLRFTRSEATDFLTQRMGLNLSVENIAALEARTEGWIAGLQLAALSLRRHTDIDRFVESFSGSHHFVLDYLVEEVLLQQPEHIQNFLLFTSILERLCGPLCDAVLLDSATPGQVTLEFIQSTNLFLTPLDNERRWYRYHQLFADLLKQRLQQNAFVDIDELHLRASQWYEENGLEIEAFEHAVAANDVPRAERLMAGNGVPLPYRGALAPVLNWLEALPKPVMDAQPSLWVAYASTLTIAGRPVEGIEKILQSAEAALQDAKTEEETRDHIGHVAAIRAMLAVPQNQVETIITQSHRALEFLHPENLSIRTTTAWTLGSAYQRQGDRSAALHAYNEALQASQASGNLMISIAATTSLGQIRESQNQLQQAAEDYQRVLNWTGNPPLPVACEAHIGLARIFYEWNDLDAAQEHTEHSLRLARQLENVDTPVSCEMVFARLALARGDVIRAAQHTAEAEKYARGHNFTHRLPEVAEMQVRVALHQGDLAKCAQLAEEHGLPFSQARVHLAKGEVTAALAVIDATHREMESKAWADKQLKVIILQSLVLQEKGESDHAVQKMVEALALAEPGGIIRIFVDEGSQVADLLSKAADQGSKAGYIHKLLAAFETDQPSVLTPSIQTGAQPLLEPLSPRELEILQLIAEGLSNREIGERLYLALNTVKGYNQKIFNKLQVQRRTEAVARARELGLL